jgi:hypothetical protein
MWACRMDSEYVGDAILISSYETWVSLFKYKNNIEINAIIILKYSQTIKNIYLFHREKNGA